MFHVIFLSLATIPSSIALIIPLQSKLLLICICGATKSIKIKQGKAFLRRGLTNRKDAQLYRISNPIMKILKTKAVIHDFQVTKSFNCNFYGQQLTLHGNSSRGHVLMKQINCLLLCTQGILLEEMDAKQSKCNHTYMKSAERIARRQKKPNIVVFYY